MTATSVLIILVGVFIIINAQNFVGVIQGNKTIGQTPTPKTTTGTQPSNRTTSAA